MRLGDFFFFFEPALVNIITNFVVKLSFLHVKPSASHTCLILFTLKHLALSVIAVIQFWVKELLISSLW